MRPPVKEVSSVICINITDNLHRLTQCLRHAMWQRVNSLRIKVPPLINNLVLTIKKSSINLLKSGIKDQATPIVFHILPHVVVYLIYRFQMVDPGSMQVLRQVNYFSHDADSDKSNFPTHHTNLMLLLTDIIFIELSIGVNLWVES